MTILNTESQRENHVLPSSKYVKGFIMNLHKNWPLEGSYTVFFKEVVYV